MLLFSFCASLACASTNDLAVRVEVTDGSVLMGATRIACVKVITSYADVELPMGQTVLLRFTGTNGAVAANMRNGDVVSGQTPLRSFRIDTAVGTVDIPVSALRRIDVRLALYNLPAALAESLVLHYSFDGDDGEKITDRSRMGNHGRAVGRPAFTPDGRVGGAIVLDGVDDHIDAGNAESLRLASNFTMAAWVRVDSLAAPGGAVMGRSSNPEQDGRAIEMYLSHEGALCGYFWQEGNQFFSGTGRRGSVAVREWRHVVMQHDASLGEHQMRFYMDGAEHKAMFGYETVSSVPTVRWTGEPVRVGSFRPGCHQFKGLLDEVMIFNRVLTADEVKALYDAAR
jgi:hypothetical protein